MTLHDVLIDVSAPQRSTLEVHMVVGLVRLRPTRTPAQVDAQIYWLDRRGAMQPIRGTSGIATGWIQPGPVGPVSILMELGYPVERTGLHGVNLFDPNGAFGRPLALLASCQFLLRAT